MLFATHMLTITTWSRSSLRSSPDACAARCSSERVSRCRRSRGKSPYGFALTPRSAIAPPEGNCADPSRCLQLDSRSLRPELQGGPCLSIARYSSADQHRDHRLLRSDSATSHGDRWWQASGHRFPERGTHQAPHSHEPIGKAEWREKG